MIVNFRARKINRDARKLVWTPTLIKKKIQYVRIETFFFYFTPLLTFLYHVVVNRTSGLPASTCINNVNEMSTKKNERQHSPAPFPYRDMPSDEL
jgi:hypothetical protein